MGNTQATHKKTQTTQGKPEAMQGKPFKTTIVDFNGNRYTIDYPSKQHIFYRGTRPIQSSSGFYNGGPDASYNFKSEKQAEQLLYAFNDVLNDVTNLSEERLMGTWILKDQKSGKNVYVKKGQKLGIFVQKLKQACSK